MNYIELSVDIKDSLEDVASAIIGQFDAVESIQFSNKIIKVYLSEESWTAIQSDLIESLNDFQWAYSTKRIQPKNWNEEWEKNFNPIGIGDNVWVRADFHEPNVNYAREIIINPKNAFGTGHHETTYMMMNKMGDLVWKDQSCLDFGAGTGILSIWAYKLGCRDIYAIDNSPDSIENILENLGINDVPKDDCIVQQGSIDEIVHSHFDIILANINRNVLETYADLIIEKLRPNGHLLLSGILKSDSNLIMERYKKLDMIHISDKGDWICVLFQNKVTTLNQG